MKMETKTDYMINTLIGTIGGGISLVAPMVQNITEIAQMIGTTAGAAVAIVTLFRMLKTKNNEK